MTRDEAVARINRSLGFRPTGWVVEAEIQKSLKEAQRNLERGKTLPKFLIQQDQTLTLLSGQHTVNYPTGFLRESDDTRIRYFPTGSTIPFFLSRRLYIDAVEANLQPTGINAPITAQPRTPEVYVLRPQNIDFVVTATQNYTFYWDYYKKADLLDSNITNAWLADDNGQDWLVGEAGWRIAMDLRDNQGIQIFDSLRTSARAALFGEILASDEASGPYVMGRNL